MKNVEIECKLDANTPRAFVRATRFVRTLCPQVSGCVLHIKDTYLDHAARDLAAQKIALRVRNTNGKWEATFKTCTQLINGRAVRREETLPLPQASCLSQALQALTKRKQWRNINVTQLVPQFTITNKRTVFLFDYDGATLEMALDNVTICVLGRQLKFKEIEVELKRGSAKRLEKFSQLLMHQTQLKPAQISKVKTAECLLKLFQK